MPAYKHGKMELRVSNLINQLGVDLEAIPEQTVQVREGKFLVPDVAVQRTDQLQQPYPTKPIYLCIEVLAPGDRFSETVAKCEAYHAWGVKFCWMIDPEKKLGWEYAAGDRPRQVREGVRIFTEHVAVSLEDLFAGF